MGSRFRCVICIRNIDDLETLERFHFSKCNHVYCGECASELKNEEICREVRCSEVVQIQKMRSVRDELMDEVHEIKRKIQNKMCSVHKTILKYICLDKNCDQKLSFQCKHCYIENHSNCKEMDKFEIYDFLVLMSFEVTFPHQILTEMNRIVQKLGFSDPSCDNFVQLLKQKTNELYSLETNMTKINSDEFSTEFCENQILIKSTSLQQIESEFNLIVHELMEKELELDSIIEKNETKNMVMPATDQVAVHPTNSASDIPKTCPIDSKVSTSHFFSEESKNENDLKNRIKSTMENSAWFAHLKAFWSKFYRPRDFPMSTLNSDLNISIEQPNIDQISPILCYDSKIK